MTNPRSKNTRSVPQKKAGRYRPPAVTPNPPKQAPRATHLEVSATGKRKMV